MTSFTSMTVARLFVFHILLISLFGSNLWAQTQSSGKETFEKQVQRAQDYMASNLVAEAIECLDKAANYASTPNEKIELNNLKAEFLRASGNQEQALESLWSIPSETVKKADTKQRLKRLGRLAAVHQEYGKYAGLNSPDSVTFYIKEALNLAHTNPEKYQLEIASLNNELGLFVYRRGNNTDARKYYKLSCAIYKEEKDLEGLVTPLSNLLELETCNRNMKVADELAQELTDLVEGKDWYRVMTIAYTSLVIYAKTKKDELAALRYELKLNQSAHSNLLAVNSEKMLLMRRLFEHDKLERKIETERLKGERNKHQLDQANKHKKQLVYILVGSILLVIFIVFLFIRERHIKSKINQLNSALNQANKRYELLVIESNHRIKNNLQMITAMLDYTSKGIEPSNVKVLNSISSKINAVSALHKHLYVDIHNEFISVSTYFNELVKIYKSVSSEPFHLDLDVGEVAIRSERLVYFGLIFNEMLSNTIEHADSRTKMKMTIIPLEDGYQFLYTDNSKHFENGNEGTGMGLIRNLVLRIGGKNFQLDKHTGTYQFDFQIRESLG